MPRPKRVVTEQFLSRIDCSNHINSRQRRKTKASSYFTSEDKVSNITNPSYFCIRCRKNRNSFIFWSFYKPFYFGEIFQSISLHCDEMCALLLIIEWRRIKGTLSNTIHNDHCQHSTLTIHANCLTSGQVNISWVFSRGGKSLWGSGLRKYEDNLRINFKTSEEWKKIIRIFSSKFQLVPNLILGRYSLFWKTLILESCFSDFFSWWRHDF